MTIDIKALTGRSLGSSSRASRSMNRTADRQSDKSVGNNTSDSVSITGVASQLTSLAETIRNMPVVDSARVEHVHEQVERGTYVVDAPVTAYKLVILESSMYENQA